MRFTKYLEPSVVSGIEFVGTKGSSERLLADWDWVAGLAGLKKYAPANVGVFAQHGCPTYVTLTDIDFVSSSAALETMLCISTQHWRTSSTQLASACNALKVL